MDSPIEIAEELKERFEEKDDGQFPFWIEIDEVQVDKLYNPKKEKPKN